MAKNERTYKIVCIIVNEKELDSEIHSVDLINQDAYEEEIQNTIQYYRKSKNQKNKVFYEGSHKCVILIGI